MAILDRMAQDERAAERRALAQRDAELTAQALAPGSALACLDAAAGEAVENACEKTVFAGPQATAAAVAYMAARLTLLADGLAFARRSDPDFAERSPACAAPSSSTASALPPMCWRCATAAPPSAAPLLRCSATPT